MPYKKRFWSIVSDIDSIVEGLDNHPDHSKIIRQQTINYMIAEANKTSAKIEADFSFKTDKSKKATYTSLFDSWVVLNKDIVDGKKNNLNSSYTHYILQKLATIIEPNENSHFGYRNELAKIGSSYKDVESIESKMDNLLFNLNSPSHHPVFNAIDAHLEFINIHPFKDGNGRLSRLIQNYFLVDQSYTPSIISSDFRKDYLKLVEAARESREQGLSSRFNQNKKESDFFSFIAESILESSKSLEEKLSKTKFFQINFSNSDVKLLNKYINCMKSYFRSKKMSDVKVNIVNSDGKVRDHVRVKGNIDRIALKSLLEVVTKKHNNITYRVTKL